MPSVQLQNSDLDPRHLPQVCMRCGDDAAVVRKPTFFWQPTAADINQAIAAFLYLVGIIVWQSDNLKSMKVPVPLCARHKYLFLWPALLQYGGLLLFILLGVLVVLLAINGPDSMDEMRRPPGSPPDIRMVWTGVASALFVLEPLVWLGALVMVRTRGIRATEITERSITLVNVAQEFADEIEAGH